MPQPINQTHKVDRARQTVRFMKQIKQYIDLSAALDNSYVTELYFRCVRFRNDVDDLVSNGVTLSELGAIIASEYDIVWADYQASFASMYSTHAPAFMSAFIANQADILQGEINGDRVQYVAMSQATKDILTPLIASMDATF